ncbi:MAG: VTT domain-containing protein [Spirochaeta sp.]|nr:VTT domain-containing protein [Spirochaeta sp.]
MISLTGALLDDYGIAAAGLYVIVMAAGIVVLPLSSLPLIPVAAAAWGVWLGGTLSALGWWIGAMIAFLVARSLGRPALVRIVGAETLHRWEARVPTRIGFLSVILMRIILPVEIPSYVLGLTRAISFRQYAIATAIGIAPFAYGMVAMGDALAAGAWVQLIIIGGAGAVVAGGVYVVYRRITRR